MIPVSPMTGRRSRPARAPFALALLVLALAPRFAAAQRDVPLPPPPPGTKRIPLPPPPPGTSLKPRTPSAAPAAESCTSCHAKITQGRVMHGALEKHACSACHRAVPAQAGKCKSRTASKWSLVKTEPELCYGCHARMDAQKFVHTVVRQGSCLSCHDAHSSNYAGRTKLPREQLCFECHDAESLTMKPVKHAPVAEGGCIDCHNAHGGNLQFNMRAASGGALCLKCHDAKAPTGKGTPGPGYRVDMGKKFVHSAFKRTDCLGCHDGGHGSENLKLLKKAVVDLCYGCHERKDKAKFPHGAVVLGDCAVCHEPHASDNPKRLTKATLNETCFICHQDDLTGRKVIHPPVAKGCDQCHDSHGAQSRNLLKVGEGKAGCYKCHKPIDTGKNKHAALERYGCGACHDPHATGHAARLPQKVNDVCVACHPGQKDGKHVTQLAAKGHVVGGNLKDPKREGREFSCASCHNAHGSNSPRLLYVGKTPMESCAWCHGDKSGKHPDLKNVISRAKRTPPAQTGAAGSGAPAGSGGGTGGGADGPDGGDPGPTQPGTNQRGTR